MPVSDGWKNLIPQNQRPKEEQRRISQLGGEANKQRCKRAKNFQEMMKLLLSAEMPDEVTGELKQVREILCDAQVQKAKAGDTRAFESIVAVAGEKPAEKHELTGKDGAPLEQNVTYITPESLEEIKKNIVDTIK